MITEETARKIAMAYREQRAAVELLAEVKDALAKGEPPDFRDSYGRPRGIQLGLPHGGNGHQLFGCSFELAETVIREHHAAKHRELVSLSAVAAVELAESAWVPRLWEGHSAEISHRDVDSDYLRVMEGSGEPCGEPALLFEIFNQYEAVPGGFQWVGRSEARRLGLALLAWASVRSGAMTPEQAEAKTEVVPDGQAASAAETTDGEVSAAGG